MTYPVWCMQLKIYRVCSEEIWVQLRVEVLEIGKGSTNVYVSIAVRHPHSQFGVSQNKMMYLHIRTYVRTYIHMGTQTYPSI